MTGTIVNFKPEAIARLHVIGGSGGNHFLVHNTIADATNEGFRMAASNPRRRQAFPPSP